MAPPSLLNPDTVHPTTGYSHAAIASGRLLIVSGQVGLDKDRKIVGVDNFEAQAVQTFENLVAVLKAGGATPKDVVRLGVILTSLDHLPKFREVRGRYFPPPQPASTLIVAGLVSPEFMLEVEALAQIPD
jgi:enamine deaminase RidA (YjgF/YER057c/UK114 family)